jgi:hypothetical protein
MLLMPVLIHPESSNHFYTANPLKTVGDRQLTGYLASEGGVSCSGAVCCGGRSNGDAPRLRPLFQAALDGCSQKSSHAGSSGDGPSICSSTGHGSRKVPGMQDCPEDTQHQACLCHRQQDSMQAPVISTSSSPSHSLRGETKTWVPQSPPLTHSVPARVLPTCLPRGQCPKREPPAQCH